MRIVAFMAVVLALGAAPSDGASQEHRHSPYAGRPSSGIAALTPEELSDLETGAGMALARAAELNHYPGPLHVLDLADSLRLSPEQRRAVAAVRGGMLRRAVELGTAIVAGERALDGRFAHAHIDATALAQATAELGRLGGELRFVHLAAHLATRDILTADQVAAYDRLRGYSPEN